SSLVAALAETEARLDHGEEDGAPESPLDHAALRRARDELGALAASFAAGRLYEKGARVVLAGRPNAGKSSLFNLILREERAIVSPEPGTTRDWIEASVELCGLPVRLVDTAGLREAASSVEAAGVARSRALADEAEAVAYLVDGSSGIDAEDQAFLASRPDALRVWSKADDPACAPAPEGFLPLSATTGAGFPVFADALLRLVAPRFGRRRPGGRDGDLGDGYEIAASATAGEAVVASPRQKALLDAAVSALDAALEAEARGAPLDAVALDLRDAADALGEMTGEIAGPEVLEAIFSRFCLGK
ncbi:MAG: GTPase, partial [Spirochaetaceae bacterium]|nr:GTPase [Spirochaetaceae bacterium]